MQRATELRSSLSRIPETAYQAVEEAVTSSARSYRDWGIREDTASKRNLSYFSMHLLSVSALGVGVPTLLGYNVAWPTIAYLVLVIAAMAGAVWGTRKLMRRNEQLEQLVEQRTAHIQMQARQLARYNAELIRSNKALQQTMDEKSKVLGVAAHDLKNSVFGIRALSEVMMEEGVGDTHAERRLSLIHNSAEDAMTLINNLLSSAASSVHGELERGAVNIGTMARLVTHSFADQAQRKGQRLSCDLPSTEVFADGDEDRLREALNNLVSNAVKYAPLNSAIQVAVTANDEDVRISVSDEGPGLSEYEQEALFTPFKRLSPEPTGNEGSSGLGLYIVKQIVERHNGDIQVESAQDEGSTFTIVVPRTDPPQRSISLGPAAESNAVDPQPVAPASSTASSKLQTH